LFLVAFGVCAVGLLGQGTKDTPSAAATRKRLQSVKISVEYKDERMSDVVKDLEEKIADAKGGGSVKFLIDNRAGVTNNITVTKYKAKDKLVAEILDEMLKPMDLGYFVVVKSHKNFPTKGDQIDGYVVITKGKARGYPEGEEPKDGAKDGDKDKTAKDKTEPKDKDKPAPKDKGKDEPKDKSKDGDKDKGGSDDDKAEQAATAKLNLAKKLIGLGKPDTAKSRLQELLKEFPKTKAADEARELLKKLK
jgi:FimV-like protein